jgi:hypothetical protein
MWVPEVSGASPQLLSSGAGVRRRSTDPGWSRSMKTSAVTPRLGLVSGKLNFFHVFFCGLECVLFATFSKGTGDNNSPRIRNKVLYEYLFERYNSCYTVIILHFSTYFFLHFFGGL